MKKSDHDDFMLDAIVLCDVRTCTVIHCTTCSVRDMGYGSTLQYSTEYLVL